MKNYEVTFIVDPVLSGEEIKATAQTYVDHLKNEGCTIVHVDEMGLRQLAYPINKRTSGVYYCIEFEAPNGELIDPMELALRRDERIMRFLSVALDKHGVKYNADKRAGKIGKVTKKKKKSDERDSRDRKQNNKRSDNNNKGGDKAKKEESETASEEKK
jgi:small subunit ribosomal protein S6